MAEKMSPVQEHFCMAWTAMQRCSLVKADLRRLKRQGGPYLNVIQKLLFVLLDGL